MTLISFDFMPRLSLLMGAVALLIALLTAAPSRAGVVELDNGDRIQGEPERIEGDELVWRSDNFGELRIPKRRITQIHSDKPYKIAGNKQACQIEGVRDEYLVYRCGEGAAATAKRAPVLTLKTLIPYQDYVRGVTRHSGKLNFWGAYADGNERRQEWNLQGEARLRNGEYRHVLGGEYALASWDAIDPMVRWGSYYSFDWFFRTQWFWYNSLSLTGDERRGLAQQAMFGSGGGYQFWELRKTALSQQLGLAYIDQTFETPEDPGQVPDESAAYGALRAATDFRYEFPGGIAFFHNNELLYSLEDAHNWQLKTTSGLSSLILSQVYSELKVDYWVDNEPLPTKERADTRMSVGVSYKW